MATENLWPETLEIDRPLSAGTILRQQAAALGQRTKNIVTAEVETRTDEEKPTAFQHDFYLSAPIIGLRYILLRAWDYIDKPYPVKVNTELPGLSANVQNEEELRELLRRIFSHEKTIRMIAQMREYSNPQPVSA